MRDVKKYVKAHNHLKARNGTGKFLVTVMKDGKVLLQVTLSKHDQVRHFQKECLKHELRVIIKKI